VGHVAQKGEKKMLAGFWLSNIKERAHLKAGFWLSNVKERAHLKDLVLDIQKDTENCAGK